MLRRTAETMRAIRTGKSRPGGADGPRRGRRRRRAREALAAANLRNGRSPSRFPD